MQCGMEILIGMLNDMDELLTHSTSRVSQACNNLDIAGSQTTSSLIRNGDRIGDAMQGLWKRQRPLTGKLVLWSLFPTDSSTHGSTKGPSCWTNNKPITRKRTGAGAGIEARINALTPRHLPLAECVHGLTRHAPAVSDGR